MAFLSVLRAAEKGLSVLTAVGRLWHLMHINACMTHWQTDANATL